MSNYLIVGLGNPGSEYSQTRHNIAWQLLGRVEGGFNLRWVEKYKGLLSNYRSDGKTFYFLTPNTFMNLSGRSVALCLNFYKIPIDKVIVIHDELDLDYGVITFKRGGGLAGHNGLKSIKEECGTQEFLRMRLGIGRPTHGNVSSYVLGKFSNDEQCVFETYMDKAGQALKEYIDNGFSKAAQKYSKKKLI